MYPKISEFSGHYPLMEQKQTVMCQKYGEMSFVEGKKCSKGVLVMGNNLDNEKIFKINLM